MRAIVLASLETAPSLDVVAVTGSEAEAIDLLSDGRLDIVLLDGEADRLPALVHRVEALAGTSSARIVCFVSSGDARRIGALLRAGAESCVATSVAPDDLATVVREASRGTIFHAPPTSLDLGISEAPAPLVSGLTHRELEVLTLAAGGSREQADRAAPLGDAEDDQVPLVQRLPQARRVEPHRGDAPGAAPRAAAGRRPRRRRLTRGPHGSHQTPPRTVPGRAIGCLAANSSSRHSPARGDVRPGTVRAPRVTRFGGAAVRVSVRGTQTRKRRAPSRRALLGAWHRICRAPLGRREARQACAGAGCPA